MDACEPQINPFEDDSALRALRGLPPFEEGLARLLHTAEHGRHFGIVRGPAGVGKTALLECVASEFRHGGNECGVIDLRRTSADEFAWRVACELGGAPDGMQSTTCWRIIEDTVLGRSLASRVTLLLLDHLDAADASLGHQVERLLSVAEASAGWFSILCAARTASPVADSIAREHADLRIELAPLDADETCQFLRHVVRRSGCTPFHDDAMRLIDATTGGVVRDVLRLGRLALLAQATEETAEVTAEIVEMVTGEVSPLPARPHLDSRSVLPTVVKELSAPTMR